MFSGQLILCRQPAGQGSCHAEITLIGPGKGTRRNRLQAYGLKLLSVGLLTSSMPLVQMMQAQLQMRCSSTSTHLALQPRSEGQFCNLASSNGNLRHEHSCLWAHIQECKVGSLLCACCHVCVLA